MSLGGIATYLAVFCLIALWIIPWVILSLILGGISDVDARGAIVMGLLLGPLSVIIHIFLAVNKKSSDHDVGPKWNSDTGLVKKTDPFS